MENISNQYEQFNELLSREYKVNGEEAKLALSGEMPTEDLEKIAEKTLGETTYDCMLKFFCGVLCAEYDYKIIQPGITYTLFQIFSRIIFEQLEAAHANEFNLTLNNVYTTTYLYGMDKGTLRCKLKDKTVLIVDIALINGCELSELIEHLASNGVTKTATCVFTELEQADAISEPLVKSKQAATEATLLPKGDEVQFYSVMLDALGMRTFINILYRFIQQTNYTCAAFSNSYPIASNITSDTLKQAYSLSYGGTIQQTRLQRYVNAQQEVIIANIALKSLASDNCSSEQILSGIDFMIRRYFRQNKMENIIPFTLLPMMRADVLNDVYNLTGKDETADSQQDVDVLKYRYKQLSYRLSDYFVKKNAEIGNEIIGHSKHSFDITDNDNKELISSFLLKQQKATDVGIYNLNAFDGWTDAARILRDVLNSIPIKSSEDICGALLTYIDRLHQYNKNQATYNQKRLQGISIHNMLGLLYATAKQKNLHLCSSEWSYILGFILNMCDNGIAKYDVDTYFINGSYWIDGCITDGEQAYCAIFEKKEYDDFLVCAQIMTQGTNDVYTGIQRLADMESKLSEASLIPDCIDFSKIKEFYIQNGTLEPIAENIHSGHWYNHLLIVASR